MKDLEFERQDFSSQDMFLSRWGIMDTVEQEIEGIISVMFCKEGCVIGEFIGNNNVETSMKFIPSFVFVVDEFGKMQKFNMDEKLFDLSISD